jgi:tRNA threonylcarbamoyladenosine biosynthesis protein TsaE
LFAASAEETRAIGARLAAAVVTADERAPLVIGLSGDLGAGKTTLVGGLLAELGHVGPVRSPTYTLVELYRLQGRDIVHCDLYRLRHPDELDDLGLRDMQGPGSMMLVEWPEQAAGRLGLPDLALALDYAEPDARDVRLDALTPAGEAVLHGF